MMNTPCKNDKNKYSNQVSSLVPAEFLAFLKTTTFDFAMLILNLWTFLIKKRHCSSKFKILCHNNFTIIKCFSKSFWTYLTILKCTSKGLRMVFEKFALHSYQIWTLYNTPALKNLLSSDSLTAWKVFVFGVILVRIFPHSDWTPRKIPHLSVFSPNMGKSGPE